MVPLRCWRKCKTQGLPGEAECEKSRGSDLGVCGDPLAPQNSGAFGILHPLPSKCGTVQAVVAGTSPSTLPSNGRTLGRARPVTTGNFPSQTQGDCGTDGTFPLLPPWETKGSYFKILPLFRHVGGPEEARASPKHRIKTQTHCSRGPGQELPDCPDPSVAMGEAHWGGSEDTQEQNDRVTCRENTAWSWSRWREPAPAGAEPGCWSREGCFTPVVPTRPPPAQTQGQAQPVSAFTLCLWFLLHGARVYQ